MRQVFSVVVGLIVFLAGATFMLQGTNVLQGSGMSGQPFWAVVGVVMVAVGAAICYTVLRPKPVAPSKYSKKVQK